MTYFLHEQRYRDMASIKERLVTICGAGALGSNLAESLARMGFRRLRVIDRDQVATHNLSTQPWTQQDIRAAKVHVLAAALSRAVALRIESLHTELTPNNAMALLRGSEVVVDAFDNVPSRAAVTRAAVEAGCACLHIALGAEGDYGCGLWDGAYWEGQVSDVSASAMAPCDYPLARPLALMVAAAAAETLAVFLSTGVRRGFEVTLRDLRVVPV